MSLMRRQREFKTKYTVNYGHTCIYVNDHNACNYGNVPYACNFDNIFYVCKSANEEWMKMEIIIYLGNLWKIEK